ncbi:tagaturonate reductase [Metabacillus arenae]|uniref:Altronate oxidoreductase n=1 Tax=Metabacillus arenae TaxID=2771434 RepID=A0A926RY36_9BACI|nr:tagaturonate reductase [Metabacillus arenae]MBD1382533.1 tagaturonate reductase [Metabacillus arenae]
MQKLNKQTWTDYNKYPEKVLQFGTGNFLRAFTDWQIDKMNKNAGFNGSIVVAQSTNSGTVEKLNNQDGLFTLFLQGIKGSKPVREHHVINSISRGINLLTDQKEFFSLAEKPELRFVFSNTTEAGIVFNKEDRLNDNLQKSFPGKLTDFLYHRFKAFKGDEKKGLIIIPCELIEHNGRELKKVILQYADLWSLEEPFIHWIHKANTFCCTLVDRIVPGYPKDSIKEMTESLGFEDELIVVGEQYHLFVIEGPKWIEQEFPAEKAGLNVKFVQDISPYRMRKVRILNGAHTAMTPVAYLAGIETVREAVTTEETKQFVEELIYKEIIPTLDLPKEELELYGKDTLDRFSNPFLKHYLSSIALNSISKYKTRNLPTLLDYYEKYQQLPQKLVFSLSALIQFYKGKRGSEGIALADDKEILTFFEELWKDCDGTEEGLERVAARVLANEKLWNRDLTEIEGLTELVSKFLIKIHQVGMKEAVQDVLSVRRASL